MMLVEETTTPTADLPVDQFKAHLRLGTGFADDAVQDPVLESFLRAAFAAIEARTGKILMQREFSWSLDQWRDTGAQALPVAPIDQLVDIVSIDGAGVETPLTLADFALRRDHHKPHLLATGSALPNIPNGGQIRVHFLAGFATTFDRLPPDLGQAVLLLATHFYENRNAVGMGDNAMPFGVSVLVERYKTLRILGGSRR